tara:strand:- start:671 stop:1465 length:795 start_codon:yes stop_codon:yes gene_type:complete
MKLLVGSVYCNSPRNETWHKLQMQFLQETTSDFDHLIIITQDTDYNIFEQQRILKVLPAGHYKKLRVHGRQGEFTAHLDGCNEFLHHYYNHSEYDHLLLLDSDCFPIRKGWQELLVEKMGNKQFAAPFRTENLDLYPHPCAFFLKDRTCPISFTPDKWILNQIGQRFIDSGTSIDLRWFYPLMRSNVYNPHPIFAGIYHDMFYHHCCGSRDNPSTRAISAGYFDHHLTGHKELEEILYSHLNDDPEGLINKLRTGEKLACKIWL